MNCTAITALHAVKKTKLGPNDTAMIIRAGEIGEILIQILKASGINVAATNRTQRKLEKAKDLDADLVLQQNHSETLKKIKQFSGEDEVQCVFDCVGTSSTMKTNAKYVMRSGQIANSNRGRT